MIWGRVSMKEGELLPVPEDVFAKVALRLIDIPPIVRYATEVGVDSLIPNSKPLSVEFVSPDVMFFAYCSSLIQGW